MLSAESKLRSRHDTLRKAIYVIPKTHRPSAIKKAAIQDNLNGGFSFYHICLSSFAPLIRLSAYLFIRLLVDYPSFAK
jgi:hypothetical protein